MKNRKNGYTLAEILIVTVIMAIMATLAVPRLFPTTEKGRVGEASAMLGAIRQGEEAYRLENSVYKAIDAGDLDPTWNLIGISTPNTTKRFFNYSVLSADGTSFTATATRCVTGDGNGCVGDGTYTGTVTLNNAGTLGGTHPLAPKN